MFVLLLLYFFCWIVILGVLFIENMTPIYATSLCWFFNLLAVEIQQIWKRGFLWVLLISTYFGRQALWSNNVVTYPLPGRLMNLGRLTIITVKEKFTLQSKNLVTNYHPLRLLFAVTIHLHKNNLLSAKRSFSFPLLS